jgi:hypothetical protein
MPISFSGSTISSTYAQLLHIDGGPTSGEKTIYSGAGVDTAAKLGTTSMSVGNVQLTGNTIQAVSGSLTLGTNIAFASASNARTALGLGTLATQNASAVAVTGGTVAFEVLAGRAYAEFYDADTADQAGSITDRTAVQFSTARVTGAGVTVASNSSVTLAVAGTYRFSPRLQFVSSDTTARQVTVWFAKNGTAIANSATRMVVPSATPGGSVLFTAELIEAVAANDYIEVFWFPDDADITLKYVAAVAANPGVTPAIPAIPPAAIVVERIA